MSNSNNGFSQVIGSCGNLGMNGFPRVTTPEVNPFADVGSMPQLWWRSDTIEGKADGDRVPSWLDSANLVNIEQATTAKQPIYKTNIQNGLPALRFDYSDATEFSVGNMSTLFPTAATLFVIVKTHVADNQVWYQTTARDEYWEFTGGTGYMGVFRSARIDGYPNSRPAVGMHYFTVRSSSSAYEMWWDGVSKGAQAAGYSAGTQHRIGANTTGSYSEGDLFEIIIFPAALDSSQLDLVHNYIRAKYGVA